MVNMKLKTLLQQDVGSIGIGAMIVFIAMVLVAGIAASVLVQTSTRLEAQAMVTGSDTTKEVGTGLSVSNVLGYVNKTTANSPDISRMAIMVRTRAGSEEIDISETYLEISDSTRKVIMNYTAKFYRDVAGAVDIFQMHTFLDNHAKAGAQYGVIVVEDADHSISSTTPVMNKGDKLYICVNATAALGPDGETWPSNGISERTKCWGMVVPEHGSPGILKFTTPASYPDAVMDLQ